MGVSAAADPTAQSRPSPFAFYAFAFLVLALVGLLFSLSRHLRIARRNLGAAAPGDAVAAAGGPAERSEPPR